MEHKTLEDAIMAAWRIYCKTGNWKPYAAAFKALYGHKPVYLPQYKAIA